jgi:NAD(P)-dependent dehydrogenase (short-subunit alcohol dehydrogenase family)
MIETSAGRVSRLEAHLVKVFGLRGRSVVVTGGSSGIGKGIARLFVTAGAKVVVAGSTASKVAAVAAELKAGAEDGADCIGIPVDVTSEHSVIHLFDSTVATFGDIDVLVNCAGIFPFIPFLEASVELWDRVHAVNTRGVFLCCQQAVKHMKAAGKGGAIVNVSSTSSQQTTVYGQAQYGSSKAGVNMLTKTIALEFARDQIRANAVLPGGVMTEGSDVMLSGKNLPEGPCMNPDRFPLGRPGQIDEIANACLFLASPAASYVTGQLLTVDGGFCLG